MQICIIVAMSDNQVIGKDNSLPWHLPEDLRHFKQKTLGKPIIMGRRTYESIGHALPGRHNIILTKDVHFRAESCTIVHSVDEALKRAFEDKVEEVYVIGGSSVYEAFLPLADELYLTKVQGDIVGDTYFPIINWENWLLQQSIPYDKFAIMHFKRIQKEL